MGEYVVLLENFLIFCVNLVSFLVFFDDKNSNANNYCKFIKFNNNYLQLCVRYIMLDLQSYALICIDMYVGVFCN